MNVPMLGLGKSDARVLRHQHEIGVDRHFGAGAERVAVDRGNHRFRQPMDARANLLRELQVLALLPARALALRVLLEIRADAERAAFARQNDDAHVAIALGGGERVERLAKQRFDDRVEPMRAG